MMLFCN